MPPLPLFKMHGNGNDFVVLAPPAWSALETRANSLEFSTDRQLGDLARVLCARRWGVGADGLLTLEAPDQWGRDHACHWRMRMWNPDGTPDMCGNGLRCAAALAWRLDAQTPATFRMQTLAGARHVERLDPTPGLGSYETGRQVLVRAAIGFALWRSDQVPIRVLDPRDFTLRVEGREFNASALSTGSTHTVILIPNALSDADFISWSSRIETDALFPERTSVSWVHRPPLAPTGHWQARIWERGVGETLSCGTGACAVAATLWERGLEAYDQPITVQGAGGSLLIERDASGALFKTGPARLVFKAFWPLAPVPEPDVEPDVGSHRG